MKKFRFIIALAIVVTMISTFAFAATDIFTTSNIECNAGDNVTVTLKFKNAGTLTSAAFAVKFDNTVWTVDKADITTPITGADKEVSGLGQVVILTSNSCKYEADSVAVSFIAKPIEGANVDGSKFYLCAEAYLEFDDGDYYYEESNDAVVSTVTVKSAEPEKPVIAKNEKKGATIESEDTIYTNIFKGEYSAKAASNVVISEIGIKYHATDVNDAKAEKLSKAVSVEGGAAVNFKAAILGVAADTELVVEPYTVYAFAK